MKLSILTVCNRFLQRLKVMLYCLAHQTVSLDEFEVLVANPQSPDGLSEYLKAYSLAGAGEHRRAPRVTDVAIDPAQGTNKGLMLNAAFKASSGSIIVILDADMVVPPDFVDRVARESADDRLLWAPRHFLTPVTTARLVAGLLDPAFSWGNICTENVAGPEDHVGPFGYFQAVTRKVFERTGYLENAPGFDKTDVDFLDRAEFVHARHRMIEGLTLLHMHHPRDWSGPRTFL